MKQKYKLTLLLILASYVAYGQDDWSYKSKFQLRPEFGVGFPLARLMKGSRTDNLIQFSDRSSYLQVISFTAFLSKHWGIELAIQPDVSSDVLKKGEKFSASVEKKYSQNYYPSSIWGNEMGSESEFGNGNGHGYLGVIYRFEKHRFFVYPKFSIGLTSIGTDTGQFYLKEKNSNTTLEANYKTDKNRASFFTVAPGISFGYKLTKHLFASVNVAASYFKSNLSYTNTLKDLYSGEVVSLEAVTYKRDVATISIGAGIALIVNKY